MAGFPGAGSGLQALGGTSSTSGQVGTGTPDQFATGVFIPPQTFAVLQGSDASPVTTVGPTVKIGRVEQLSVATVQALIPSASNLTNEASATLVVYNAGHSPVGSTAGTYMQSNAIFAYAFNDGPGTWDAVTIQSVGRTLGTSTRRATAFYGEGRKDNDTGLIGTCEFRVNNQNPTNDPTDATYVTSGASTLFGLLMSAATNTSTANNVIAEGMKFISTNGTSQWGVGIGFSTTAIANNDIRSDSGANNSLFLAGNYLTSAINIVGSPPTGILISTGTFSSAAIAVNQASNAIAGPVIIGGTARQTGGTFLEVQGAATAGTDPLVVIGRTDVAQKYSLYIRNSGGTMRLGVAGTTNDFLTGTAAGDQAIVTPSSGHGLYIGGTTKVIGVTQANALGFFAVTPAAQPAGSTDVLASLVTLGLRAASANPPLNLGTGILSGGTNTASANAVTSPTLGAAAQLAQTTQDAMIYIDITVAATGFQIAIGATVAVANTLTTGAAPAIGSMYTVRLPAGWYIAVTSTTGSWTAKAITC